MASETVQTQTSQNDDLTAIFGNLGADVHVPAVDVNDDGLEAPIETQEEPGAESEGQPPVEEGTEVKPADGEEPPAPAATSKPQPHIPPAVAKQLRQDRRDLQEKLAQAEVARARAEARAELLEELHQKGVFSGKPAETTPAEVEKSPLEQFAEEFPDESPTTKVLLEQRKWEQNQQQAQARKQEAESRTMTLAQQVNQGIETAKAQYAKLGEGLGLDDVVGLAKAFKLISQNELEALSPLGLRAGTMAYNLAVDAIRSAGGPAFAELSRRVAVARSRQASSVSQTQPNVNGKQPKPNKTATPAQSAGGTPSDDSRNSPITNFIFGKR